MKKLNLFIKRLIDILGSLIGILLLSPLLIVTSIIILLESDGPVFFKQERLGYKGEVFRIIKFRTMIQNAENIGDGLSIKTEHDPRITRVGSFLRKTSIDELPQLFNVLKGEMSLVGPRPPVTYHPYEGYSNYPEWAKKRFEMRPGITGLAQIKVRNAVSWDERIEHDVVYIKNFNIKEDIVIIFRTIFRLFQSEDVYMEYKD